ncbi:MAG: prephenate dehydratase [Chloroflexi bacterium]|nr:prephenate dehydratase [Chloroflexota bacterium]
MLQRIAYFGPAGTFTEAAALKYAPQGQLLPFPSIAAAAEAVSAGQADEGVVPIENSLEGSVTDTLDLLIHGSDLQIRRELVIPIEHCLLVRPGTGQEDIRVIYSHPQALGQCRGFLGHRFPQASLVPAMSTAAAAERLQQEPKGAAAIGNLRAAELYGMQVLARSIQDNAGNATRFVALGPTDSPPTGDDKTSLCFSFAEDRPGLLYAALGEFARRGINLLKVESRPTKQSLGQYIFLLDLAGHRTDAMAAQAVEALRRQVAMLKMFGSYPRYREGNGGGSAR